MIDKIRTFAEALGHFDLDGVYIKPALRELFEKVTNSPRGRPLAIENESP